MKEFLIEFDTFLGDGPDTLVLSGNDPSDIEDEIKQIIEENEGGIADVFDAETDEFLCSFEA